MYRVIFRHRVTDPWQEELHPTRRAAFARKAALRARLWAAVVQTQDAAGQWIDV